MTESKIEVGDPPVSMPRITIRDFLLGMLAMAVLNWAVLILFVSAIPLLALVGAAFLHSSLFKMHILFVLGLIIAISLAHCGDCALVYQKSFLVDVISNFCLASFGGVAVCDYDMVDN